VPPPPTGTARGKRGALVAAALRAGPAGRGRPCRLVRQLAASATGPGPVAGREVTERLAAELGVRPGLLLRAALPGPRSQGVNRPFPVRP
jgi:hypothetical protein